MKLPTDIPDCMHVDLESDAVVVLTPALDRIVQIAMVRVHREMMRIETGKDVGMNEAFADWVAKGYAEKYRAHYKVIPTTER